MPTSPEFERFRARARLFGLLDEAGQRRHERGHGALAAALRDAL